MCVMFWSQEGNFSIPYVIETIRYELPKRRVHANVSAVFSKEDDHKALVGVVHRRSVRMEPAIERWHMQAAGRADPVVDLLSRLYDGSFAQGAATTVRFSYNKIRSGVTSVMLAGAETGFEPVVVEDPAYESLRLSDGQIPYTSYTIGPLDDLTNQLYSFDIKIEGPAFDALMDRETGRSVDGAAILKSRILNEDLALLQESRWRGFFAEDICANVVKPKRYDVVITNTTGTLPTCYRLCSKTRREPIADESLGKKAAWFTSDDPEQDFIIELEFEEALRTRSSTYRNGSIANP